MIFRPIFISLSPNTEKDDILLAFKLLFSALGGPTVGGQSWKNGPAINSLEGEFKKCLGVKYAFSFNSGRSAFLAILNSLNLKQDDEILLQAFTCNAVVNPILWTGLKPVYVDCNEKTFNIDLEDLKKKIGPKSRVVVIQHTFGLSAEMDEISEVCQKYNLILVEDCAHSLGATYKGEKIGAFGRVSFFSFGRDKVISSIYGGMAVTNDFRLAQKIKEFQVKCSFPSHFWIFQQLLHPILTNYLIIPLYRFFGIGGWFLLFFQKMKVLSKAVHNLEKKGKKPVYFPQQLPNALAILALNQLKKLEKFNRHRVKIAEFYDQNLKNLKIVLPQKVEGRIYLRYPLLIEIKETSKILNQFRKRKIFLDDGWQKTAVVPPDTDQEKMEYRRGSCPKAEKIAKEIINLPTHINISLKEAKRITKFLKTINGVKSR